MSWLDSYFTARNYGLLQYSGVVMPPEAILNFSGSGVSLADDPTNGRTTVTVSSFVPTGTGIPHVVSGTLQAATSLIVNADVNASAAIAYSKMGIGTQSIGAQQFDTTVDTKGTCRTKEPVSIGTTDATVTTLDSFTIPTDACVIWTAVVSAMRDDETQGAAYIRTAVFKNAAGSVAQIGATQDGGTFESNAAWDCTIDNSTTTIRCRVTGAAAVNIRWTVIGQRLEVVY